MKLSPETLVSGGLDIRLIRSDGENAFIEAVAIIAPLYSTRTTDQGLARASANCDGYG
jgi:hypothetical protein